MCPARDRSPEWNGRIPGQCQKGLPDETHRKADEPSSMIFVSLDLGLLLVIELTDERVQLVERAR